MKSILAIFLLTAALTWAACNNDRPEEPDQPTTENSEDDMPPPGQTTIGEPRNLGDALQRAQKSVEDAGLGNQAEVINFRELQGHLPAELADMKRTKKGGQTTNAMGVKVSVAEAEYETDDGTEVEITIADTGGLGMGMVALAAWTATEFDQEDENGSKRTSTLDGYKSFEETRNRDNSAELSVVAEGRYVVTARCSQCQMELLKKAVRDMGLNDLPKGKS